MNIICKTCKNSYLEKRHIVKAIGKLMNKGILKYEDIEAWEKKNSIEYKILMCRLGIGIKEPIIECDGFKVNRMMGV